MHNLSIQGFSHLGLAILRNLSHLSQNSLFLSPLNICV